VFKKVSLILAVTVVLVSCAGPGEQVKDAPKLRLAVQYGLGYAPAMLAGELGYFERYLPGVEVEWLQFGGGSITREAVIAGDVDVGIMGVPPFLIGWDKGVEWKIVAPMGVMPVSMQTWRDDIESLADFGPDDRIVFYTGSLQHILLSMAAEEQLGDPAALDELGVAMAHPDGMAALFMEDEIAAHYTSPPYVFEEMKREGVHVVLDGFEAFGGPFTFVVAVATEAFYEENPRGYAAYTAAIADAMAFINEHPEEAAKILAPMFKLDEATALEYLTWPGVNYSTTPYGLMGFAPFMQEAGYIERVPGSLHEIAFPNVAAAAGRDGSPVMVLQGRP